MEWLRLLGDLDQLTQVLENLIGNALKHTPGESLSRCAPGVTTITCASPSRIRAGHSAGCA
jgi:signal transduction histidine kinase